MALVLAAGGLACAHPPPPRSLPAAVVSAPVPESSPPRPGAAGETAAAELRLNLAAGTYVRLAILSTTPELVVRQLAPDGRLVEELQLSSWGVEPARLSWVAAAAGEYRWTVAPRDPRAPPGAQVIALEEQRPSGPCDAARERAERAVFAARLVQRGEDPAAAGARALLGPASADALAVGESAGLLAVRFEAARVAPQGAAGTPDGADPYRRLLDLARELGDLPAQAEALQQMAQRLPDDRQLAALRAALDLRRQIGDEDGEGRLLYLVGYHLETHGEAAPALQSYLQALALLWRTGDAYWQAVTLCELGSLSGRMGDPDLARDYLEVGLERGAAAGDLENQVFALREIARLDMDLGELQAAHDAFARAHDLLAAAGAATTAGTASESAWSLEGLAASLLYLGEPRQARQRYEEMLSAFEALRDPRGRAYALLGIGSTFEAERQPARSLAYFQQALELVRASGLHAIEGLALYDLGRIHRDAGQPEQAIADLEAAFALEAADSPVRQAHTQVELANAYRQAGKRTAAESAFRHAIRLAAGAPLVEAAAQAGLARARRDAGDLVAARAAIARALALTETLRAGVIRPDQRVSFLAARRDYFELDVELLAESDRIEPGAGHDAEALAASEQARARGLLDLLAKERVDVRRGVPAELKQREAEIGERIARLQIRLWSGSQTLTGSEARRLGNDLDQATDEEKDLDAEIRRRQPAYAEVRTPRPLPLAEIQGLLDEDTALLEFFVGEASSQLFVVTRQGLAIHALPSRRQLDPLVQSVLGAVEQDSRLRGRRYAEDAYRLYQTLLQPAAGELRGKRRLMVAPDGPLYLLSFEALLTGEVPGGGAPGRDLPYLIRERSVSYVPSASVLAQLLAGRRPDADAAAPAGGKLFVGFGDPGQPAADPQPGQPLPLPAAREEVSRIASLFPADQAVVFLGPEATEETVKTSAAVRSARILHFASHGLLDESRPDLSGLRLAHAGGSAEDGLLQVREIFNLELHAGLVVLSACQTGLGKEVSGEGLIGMTRAFLYAGASSLVVSLWQVDDESTADLMVSFYRQLRSIGDRSEALRRAKLELIDRSRYFHPYFWAPFILVGLP
jgi:CHAT domain-containing protein